MGFIKSFTIRLIELTFSFFLVALTPGLPPYMEFTAFSVPSYMPFEGPLSLNERLNNTEHLFENHLKGPEAFATYNGVLYTGIHGGEVVKIVGDNIVPVVKFGTSCDGYWEERKCGRPLGLKFDKNGKLYVADAYYGIYKVDVSHGTASRIVPADIPIEGKKPLMINGIDVSSDGTIYWSHSSSDVLLEDGLYAMLGDGTGRLLEYNPSTNSSKVLLDNLHFANGVLLSPKEDFVLVSETVRSRIHRYYLKGVKKGSSDIFIERLPGHPDNLILDDEGGYFVPLVFATDGNHPSIIHVLGPYPIVRKFLARLLALMEMPFQFIERIYPNYYTKRITHWLGHFESANLLKPKLSTFLRLDGNGKLVDSFHCLDGTLSSVSEVIVFEDAFYFGSPYNTYIGRVKIPKPPRISVRIKTPKEVSSKL